MKLKLKLSKNQKLYLLDCFCAVIGLSIVFIAGTTAAIYADPTAEGKAYIIGFLFALASVPMLEHVCYIICNYFRNKLEK